MNKLSIKVLELNEESPWANPDSMKVFEGETQIEESIVLVGGMASGLPSLALKIPTQTGWVFGQISYNNLIGLADVMKGVAARTSNNSEGMEQ